MTLLRGDSARRKPVRIALPEAQRATWLAKLVLPGTELTPAAASLRSDTASA